VGIGLAVAVKPLLPSSWPLLLLLSGLSGAVAVSLLLSSLLLSLVLASVRCCPGIWLDPCGFALKAALLWHIFSSSSYPVAQLLCRISSLSDSESSGWFCNWARDEGRRGVRL
jgi:hypothetical protein